MNLCSAFPPLSVSAHLSTWGVLKRHLQYSPDDVETSIENTTPATRLLWFILGSIVLLCIGGMIARCAMDGDVFFRLQLRCWTCGRASPDTAFPHMRFSEVLIMEHAAMHASQHTRRHQRQYQDHHPQPHTAYMGVPAHPDVHRHRNFAVRRVPYSPPSHIHPIQTQA